MANEKDNLLDLYQICEQHAFNEDLVKNYLGEPAGYRTTKTGTKIPQWSEASVRAALERPEVRRAVRRVEKRRSHAARKREARRKREQNDPVLAAAAQKRLEARKAREKALREAERLRRQEEKAAQRRAELEQLPPEVRDFMAGFDLEHLLTEAAFLDRRFVLHVGPTNSGKTYDAMEAMRRAGSGVYLGPLRLLALEMFDKLNAAGRRCHLVTGEEQLLVDGASHTASTIELCDFRTHYDVAVIDEAQMLSDPARGAHWTRAILGVDAAEIHVCFAPEALDIIRWMLDQIGAAYEIVEHTRLCPLVYQGKLPSLRDVLPGDALITFSRNTVLGLAAELERREISASVIYGKLPPASRREEVRKFAAGETQVVVATDAIGMGISLPIRRVIFCETQKFDGTSRRALEPVEVRQIAGRAGRYGLYDVGEVLTLADDGVVERGLVQSVPPIDAVVMPFPKAALQSDYPLQRLLHAWQILPVQEREKREDLSDALSLLRWIERPERNRELVYDLITCPVDTSTPELVAYWRHSARRILRGSFPKSPVFPLDCLDNCELQYRAWDIYSQLCRRMGRETNVENEKREVSARINEFLLGEKSLYQRRCPQCGKPLPFNWQYRVCDECRFHRQGSAAR